MSQRDDQLPERLPDKLAGDLHALFGHGPRVPQRVDDAVLSAGRRHLRRQRWIRPVLYWIGPAAAAAAVLIALRLFTMHTAAPDSAHAPNRTATVYQAADINGDGRVDILDALALAKHVKDHDKLDPRWDINGDGVVDERDAQAISHMAVSVGGAR